MKILKNVNNDNIMLLNVIYHKPNKAQDRTDAIDIVYKLMDTDEVKVETIYEPEIEIYFAKEEFRNYNYNKSHIELSKTDMHTCKFRELPFYIADVAGKQYKDYIRSQLDSRNYQGIQNMHRYRYVFGSDYDIENWYRIQWFLNHHNDKPKTITKGFLDIEVDGIDFEGFPKHGECPINAVTIVDESKNNCYTFLLRNENNPQIQEFEDTIDDFINDLHVAFDESYGKLNYNIFMYDKEEDLIKDLFRLINTLKLNFLLIWNMGFDIPYIIDRMEKLGLDSDSIMCHRDFKVKEKYYVKDKRNFSIENKSDYFKISSYTTYIDQMILYGGLRKGGGEIRSFTLSYISQKEIGDDKLDYSEDADIKTLPYVDFKKFVMYNIKDVLLQMGIERKTNDVDALYERSYTNVTSYYKIFKQTV